MQEGETEEVEEVEKGRKEGKRSRLREDAKKG